MFNVDTAVKEGVAAIAWVEKDWTGTLLDIGAMRFGECFVVATETWVVFITVLTAMRKDLLRIFVECDNLIVMRALQHDGPSPWEVRVFVDEIRDLREGF